MPAAAPARASASAPPPTAGNGLPLLARLRHLPRDTRDTLFQLAVIGWTVLPHLLHLPAWCSALTVAVLLWRARLAWTGGNLPSRWLISGLLAVATGLTLWGGQALWGKEAGVTMLVVLLALKTLELRARRDALVVFFLGFFLVLTHFLYSQSLGAGVWMLGAVWGLLSALALSHMPVGRPPLARAGGIAARAALLGLPLMALLFLLFPRIGPLWGLPQDGSARTGLSGSLRLGGVADVANDDSIALRVRFFDQVPAAEQMYFRGPVLSTFDGREWTRLVPTFPAALRPRADVQLLGQPLRYEMTVEPSRLPLLPLLELTPDRPDAAPGVPGWMLTLRPDVQWQVDRAVTERVRVQASAWLQHRHGPRQDVLGLRDLVQLPPNSNPRTLQWAAALRAQPGMETAEPRVLAAAVLQHIRSGGYTYTLQPGAYGDNAVDDFWLDRKLGFCEHFAAAFVVVMRALDVPSRIVTGYQGTDATPVDGYWIVRQSNAHAWAEYWQPGQGWVRADPTAAVAPERVQRGGSLAPQRGLVAGTIGAIDPALAARLRAQWEAVNNRWNQWVLNYSRNQQFRLLERLGVPSPGWQDLATVLIATLCGGALAGAGWAWWDRRRQDPWQRLQQRVQQALARLGVPVAPHQPPRARAQLVRVVLGAAGETLASQLEALERLRYGGLPGQPDSGAAERRWWRRFRATARSLPAQRATTAAGGTAPISATDPMDPMDPTNPTNPAKPTNPASLGSPGSSGSQADRADRANRANQANPATTRHIGLGIVLALASLAAAGPPPALAAEAARTPAEQGRPKQAVQTSEAAEAAKAAKAGKAGTAGKAGKADKAEKAGQADRADTATSTRTSRRPPPAPAPLPTTASTAPYADRPDVQAFADEVAQRRGLPGSWVLAQLARAHRQPLVQRLVMPPPAGTAKDWAAYRARFVEPQRTAAGLQFWRHNAAWLAKAEARWGVPAAIVVAIVGVETFYGRITGNFRIVEALATLAFDFPSGRSDRSAFFRSELEEALVLAQREGVDPLSLKGSFAGAMGLPQFMPGSINRFAVDFDGDGRIDLLRSSADVVGSVANFLAQHGWQRDMPTHYGVAVPVDSAHRAALLGPDIVPSFSAAQFAERGAVLDAAGQAHAGPLALVELQNGGQAPSYVAGTHNFYVVTRYNWSSYYALAVIDLAAALGGAMRQAR